MTPTISKIITKAGDTQVDMGTIKVSQESIDDKSPFTTARDARKPTGLTNRRRIIIALENPNEGFRPVSKKVENATIELMKAKSKLLVSDQPLLYKEMTLQNFASQQRLLKDIKGNKPKTAEIAEKTKSVTSPRLFGE